MEPSQIRPINNKACTDVSSKPCCLRAEQSFRVVVRMALYGVGRSWKLTMSRLCFLYHPGLSLAEVLSVRNREDTTLGVQSQCESLRSVPWLI